MNRQEESANCKSISQRQRCQEKQTLLTPSVISVLSLVPWGKAKQSSTVLYGTVLLLWFECEMPPTFSYTWKLGFLIVALFWKTSRALSWQKWVTRGRSCGIIVLLCFQCTFFTWRYSYVGSSSCRILPPPTWWFYYAFSVLTDRPPVVQASLKTAWGLCPTQRKLNSLYSVSVHRADAVYLLGVPYAWE